MDISDTMPFQIIRNLYYNIACRLQIGTNVYDLDWDVLVLLDTCRVDSLREVSSEYEFLSQNSIDSIISVGSQSDEWIANTFTEQYRDQVQETVYVSGNAYSQQVLEDRLFPNHTSVFDYTTWSTVDASELSKLDQPWKYASNMKFEYMKYDYLLPQAITDRAVVHGRRTNFDRMILHYVTPHSPYVAQAIADDRDYLIDKEMNPFKYLQAGGDYSNVWNLYLDNLRLGLDSIETLLSNIDAKKVAISADHGEAFGKCQIYGHPGAVPHPDIKRVPWVEVTATDSGDYVPQIEKTDQDVEVSDQLRALGYK